MFRDVIKREERESIIIKDLEYLNDKIYQKEEELKNIFDGLDKKLVSDYKMAVFARDNFDMKDKTLEEINEIVHNVFPPSVSIDKKESK